MTKLPVLYDPEAVDAPPPPGVSGLHAYLPGDILAERAALLEINKRGNLFAWKSRRDSRRKLVLVAAAELQLGEYGHLTDADVTRLRAELFGHARHEGGMRLGHWVALGLFLFVLIGLFG